MATYVYGCSKDKQHKRKTVQHSMKDNPRVLCDECDAEMLRIPQGFKFYMNPGDVLLNKLEDKYRAWRGKKDKR